MFDDTLETAVDLRQLTSDDVHTIKLLIVPRGPGPINIVSVLFGILDVHDKFVFTLQSVTDLDLTRPTKY